MPTETTIVKEKPEPTVGGGGPGRGRGDDGFGDDDGGFHGGQQITLQTYMTGMWLGLGAITMLFAAFTSAYIVRRGVSQDWRPTELPALLWFNTAVLVASSVTLERARRSLRHADAETSAWGVALRRAAFRRWWSLTTALGLAFLSGQIVAWRQLAARGVYLASNPSSSFFYLLTGAHGLHLLGGVVALLYVVWRAWQPAPVSSGPVPLAAALRTGQINRAPVEVTALYWHFMDGLWIYILLVLLSWR